MCSVAHFYTKWKKSEIKPVFDFDPNSTDLGKLGIASLPEAWLRENPRSLSKDRNACDSVGFSGVNSEGSVITVRLSRRHGRCCEVIVYLHLASGDEYQLPSHPETYMYNTDSHTFSAGGLTFELLEPLRRWRVIFNGYLQKKNASPNENAIVMVRFNFLWHPIYCFMTFPQDFNTNILARLLSRQKKGISDYSSPWSLFSEEWHEQFGELHGILNIQDMPESEIFVRGLKMRSHGVFDWGNVQNKISIQGYLKNGTAIHLFIHNISGGVENFVYGYICSPCMMIIQHITSSSFKLETLYKLKDSAPELSLNFKSDDKEFTLQLKWTGAGFHVYGGNKHECEISIKNVDVILNGKAGKGTIECTYRSEHVIEGSSKESLPYLEDQDIHTSSQLVVSFNDKECHSSKIVGGKGASLALMSNISGNQMFSVPSGICVTKAAFEQHLNINAHLKEALNHLQDVAWKNVPGSLQEECGKLVASVIEAQLLNTLKSELRGKLSEQFGEHFEDIRWAVRSSAIGEDSDDMSAAGQNETFLGVKSFDEICFAVQKCWASQFAFRSIEYKRQNGQLFNCGMGVVIQKMVPSEVAGVLFSWDPVTGNMSTMLISSNFGLGESVVSAMADPDTIILKRTPDNQLHVQEKQIGAKKIMVTMSDELGTEEIETTADQVNICSITDDSAIRLGKIAIFLEESFGNARDIEWAMHNDNILLLQSRPVTTDGQMTDFEIIHEFDSAMRTDYEHYTTANVGEVMPGATTPLTITAFRSQIPFMQSHMTWRMQCHRFDPTVSEFFAVFFGHIMSERLAMKTMALSERKGTATKAMEVAFYGRVLDDPGAQRMAIERYSVKSPPMSFTMYLGKTALQGLLCGERILKQASKIFRSYSDPTIGISTAVDAFHTLENHLTDIITVMISHFLVTMASSMWNLMTLSTLSKGSGDFTLEQYSDFAMLVGSCNGAESGDVPFTLRELAMTITKETDPNEFANGMTSVEALEWLNNNKQESGKKFASFLERHGHRGLKEFDMSCVSWGMKPEQVVIVLQDMLKNISSLQNQKEGNLNKVIDEIKTPMSATRRKYLSWVMKHCRNAVCYREQAKSLVIKVYEGLRLGYRHVADLMVKEGLIPDPQLIFFFTHEEIDMLIQTRSAKLIRRAKHRQRMFPYMDKLKFEEMIEGYPIPIDQSKEVVFPEGTIQITGYPVSQGVIQGPARVVTSFHDVHTIKPGEILITHATDIGWSPYFPILSGIVTEIGGLISHGAVVAREFGLPCIVGAHNATRAFQTGDIVLLNATEGTITKV